MLTKSLPPLFDFNEHIREANNGNGLTGQDIISVSQFELGPATQRSGKC